MNGMRITIFALIIMHALPIAITQLLILEYPFNERKNGRMIKWISIAANILLNGLALYEIIMYSKLDLAEILSFTCSYQDISKLATTNIVGLAISVLIGVWVHIRVCKYYQDERSLRFSGKCVLFLLLAAIPIILGYYYGHSGISNLEIVEICRRATIADISEDFLDEDALGDVCYVSVANNGILTYELDQMYLADDMDASQEWQPFQSVEIKPGETYQFYMSGEGSLDIKKNGGSIVYLSDQFGNVVNNVEVPALKRNESYKKMGSGWQIIRLVEEEEEIITVPAPSFSKESGFYDEAFELELTADPGTTIYYTLDSSNPTIESMKYSQPIYVYDRSGEENRYRSIRNVRRDYLNHSFAGGVPVDKCFVVRAVAVDGDGNFSDIITKSYFVDQVEYEDRTVISLVSDPDGLFSDEYGICVTGKAYDEWYLNAYENGTINASDMPTENYLQRGIEWERESNLEVFANADLILAQPVGIRVQGGSARHNISYKRFSIYARDEYSASDYFDVDLINEYSQHSMYTRQGDLHAISQMIGQDRDVATVDFIPVDVFLDGEFWYTTYLYEKFNEKNFSQKYNLSKDNIIFAKYGADSYGTEEGKNPLSSLATFIDQNDLSDDENYLKFNEILDIQSYIDWGCINSFLQNLDHDERANNIYWHTVIRENGQEGDTRWRLGLYDMDLIWGYINTGISSYEANPFAVESNWQRNPITEWPIYSALRKNELFCRQFVLTFMDLINTNFSIDNTMSILEKLGIENDSYQEFFENRADYIVPYMAEEFELTGTREKVTLSSNISGTPITLNTISPELQPPIDALNETMSAKTYLWTGSYFTDYPVTVTADVPGFSHWEVTANGSVQKYTDETIEVTVSKGGVRIHAVFK